MTMWLQSTALSTFLLLILSDSFRDIRCRGARLSDVTYEEINLLKAACDKNGDSCKVSRIKDEQWDFNCNCGSLCSILGTCCFDSQYRYGKPKLPENGGCEKYYDKIYFREYSYIMIRSCDPDLESDKTTVELCNSEGEDLNDPFLKIPFTDPITGISYKNYYCYACNENYSKEEPIQWKLELKSYHSGVTSSIDNLRYDNRSLSWVKNNGQEVLLNAHVPEELKSKVFQQHCDKSEIIWGCASDWNDYGNIQSKCSTYMALTYLPSFDGPSKIYRNPHCAICNYRNLENMFCYGNYIYREYDDGSHSYGGRSFFVGWFNLNNKDCEDNMVYDDFAKKCRRVFRSKRRVQ